MRTDSYTHQSLSELGRLPPIYYSITFGTLCFKKTSIVMNAFPISRGDLVSLRPHLILAGTVLAMHSVTLREQQMMHEGSSVQRTTAEHQEELVSDPTAVMRI